MSIGSWRPEAFWLSTETVDRAIGRLIQVEDEAGREVPSAELTRRALYEWLQDTIDVMLEDVEWWAYRGNSPRQHGWELALERVLRNQEVAR